MRELNNPFRRALQQHDLQIGFWLGMVNHTTAEIIGNTGFDFATLDMEHSVADVKDVVDFHRVLRPFMTSLLVRPNSHDAHSIGRIVDAGAQNLLIPMINNSQEAESIVAATRYPPNGTRGYIAGHRANGFGAELSYVRDYERDISLVVQIETVEGLENIESIAKVDGVDALFVGALDLSIALGFGGVLTDGEFQATVWRALERIRSSGKAAGMFAAQPDILRAAVRSGATLIAIGNDHSCFARAVESLHMNARRLVAEVNGT